MSTASTHHVLSRVGERFQAVVVGLVQILLMIIIALALFELMWLLVTRITEFVAQTRDVPHLQRAVQNAFAGVLLVMFGLELLESVRTFQMEHRVRLEMIVLVAIIAVGRHIIQLDFEHVSGPMLGGIAALVLALTAGYWLVKVTGQRAR
jgi:uncharacterized membrane protein (DUF373 family)